MKTLVKLFAVIPSASRAAVDVGYPMKDVYLPNSYSSQTFCSLLQQKYSSESWFHNEPP